MPQSSKRTRKNRDTQSLKRKAGALYSQPVALDLLSDDLKQQLERCELTDLLACPRHCMHVACMGGADTAVERCATEQQSLHACHRAGDEQELLVLPSKKDAKQAKAEAAKDAVAPAAAQRVLSKSEQVCMCVCAHYCSNYALSRSR